MANGLVSDFSWSHVWSLNSGIFAFLFTQGWPRTKIHRMAGLGSAGSKPPTISRAELACGKSFLGRRLSPVTPDICLSFLELWPNAVCFRWVIWMQCWKSCSVIWGSFRFPLSTPRWFQTRDPRKVTRGKLWDNFLHVRSSHAALFPPQVCLGWVCPCSCLAALLCHPHGATALLPSALS